MPATPSSPTTPRQIVLSQSSTSTLCAATLRMCTWRATTIASAPNQSSVNGMCASLSATGSWRVVGHSASTAASPKTAVLGKRLERGSEPRRSARRSTAASAGFDGRRCAQHEHQQLLRGALRELAERVGQLAGDAAPRAAAGRRPASASRTKSSSRSSTTPTPLAAALRDSTLAGASSSWNSW